MTEVAGVKLETSAEALAEIKRRLKLRYAHEIYFTLEEMLEPLLRDFDKLLARLSPAVGEVEGLVARLEEFHADTKLGRLAREAATALRALAAEAAAQDATIKHNAEVLGGMAIERDRLAAENERLTKELSDVQESWDSIVESRERGWTLAAAQKTRAEAAEAEASRLREEVARLNEVADEKDQLDTDLEEQSAEISRLRALVEEAGKVIEPFAVQASLVGDWVSGSERFGPEGSFTVVDDLRAARVFHITSSESER